MKDVNVKSKFRIVMAKKKTFKKKNILFNSKLHLNVMEKLVKCYV